MNKFVVHAGLTLRDSYVELNGERLPGVTGFSFDLDADKMLTVRLKIMGEVFVEGEYKPHEIAQINRDIVHPGSLRVRVLRAFRELFGTGPAVEGLANRVLSDIEKDAA